MKNREDKMHQPNTQPIARYLFILKKVLSPPPRDLDNSA